MSVVLLKRLFSSTILTFLVCIFSFTTEATLPCPEAFLCDCHRLDDPVFDAACEKQSLQQIPDWSIFSSVPEIRHLHLEDNQISVIDNGAFSRIIFRRLDGNAQLVLSNNPITTLHSLAFQGMKAPNGIELDINSCSLGRFPSDAISYIPNLTHLYMRNNSIAILKPGQFSSFNKLEKLDISDNHLVRLGSDVFKGLENSLQSIHINNAGLLRFPKNALYNLRRLAGARLDHNEINELEAELFQRFTTHSRNFVLSLGHNKITVIDTTTFHRSNLSFSYICLEHNHLGNLDFLFNPCNSSFGVLTTIDVKHNSLMCDCPMYRVVTAPVYYLSGECSARGKFAGRPFMGSSSFIKSAEQQCQDEPVLETCPDHVIAEESIGFNGCMTHTITFSLFLCVIISIL